MTFPEIVKTTLWDIIDEMSRSLYFRLHGQKRCNWKIPCQQ